MKRLFLSIITVCIAFIANAQWVDDPATNTLINASCTDYNSIFQSRCPNGDFFIQFSNYTGDDECPKLMYVSKDGVPMWDEPFLLTLSGTTWSQGVSMTATSDGCAISHLESSVIESGVYAPYAYKVNAQGEIVWGPIKTAELYEGAYQCRTEIISDDNGGAWVSCCDFEQSMHIRHINADGTMGNDVQIPLGPSGGGRQQMALASDGGVLVPYHYYDSWLGSQDFNQTLRIAKISADGELVSDNVMMNTTMIQGYLELQCISDGQGGGYAWIMHDGGAIKVFNIYVMHFNSEGVCTTFNNHPLGVQVCPTDGDYHRLNASGTLDVETGDLILSFIEKDAETQSLYTMKAARVTQSGDIVGEQGGTVIVPTVQAELGQFRIACAPDRSITMVYYYETAIMEGVLKAAGTDQNFSVLWTKDFNANQCSTFDKKIAEGANEYADDQFVVFFQDNRAGANALYGQNIHSNGTMGPVVILPCDAPTNLAGEYDPSTPAIVISWTPESGNELSFNVYRSFDAVDFELIGNTTENTYSDSDAFSTGSEVFYYQVKAVCEIGESEPATTEDGETYIEFNFTGANENTASEISLHQNGSNVIINGINTEAVDVYNVSGQLVKRVYENANVISTSDMKAGMYFLNIKTGGKILSKKMIIK